MKLLILYFIPEDHDSEEFPNAYYLETKEQLTLLTLRQSFPLAGVYQFSSKLIVNDRKVWQDLVDDEQLISTEKGFVVLKISRIKLMSVERKKEPLKGRPKLKKVNSDLLDFGAEHKVEETNNVFVLDKEGDGESRSEPNELLDSLNWNNCSLDSGLKEKAGEGKDEKETADKALKYSKSLSSLSWSKCKLKSDEDAVDDLLPETKPLRTKNQNDWQDFINATGVNKERLGLDC